MSKLSKIKDFFIAPELEISPEKRDELIEKIARFVVEKGLGTVGIMTLETFKPISFVGSQMGLFFGSAFFPLIPGNWGYDLTALFSEKENVEKLIQRVETLMKEEDEAARLEKEKRKSEKPKGKRSLRNLFKRDL